MSIDSRLPPLQLRTMLTGFVAILVAAVIVLGYLFLGFGRNSFDSAPVVPTVPDKTTHEFRPTKLQWQSLSVTSVATSRFQATIVTDGTVATNDNSTVNVFSPYSGRVANVVAKLGDVVKKGDVLMTVEASEAVQAQNDLIAALGAVNTASTQMRLAQKTEERQHELLLAKAGAQKDWMQSQADLTAAQNAVRTSEVALGAVRNRLRIFGKADSEIESMEHSSDVKHPGLISVVRSPISGTVVLRQVGTGQYIQSAAGGATNPFFTVADLSSVWLVANLREADVGRVRVGQAVEVKVPAFPSRTFKGSVGWVSPLVDPTTHRVSVRVEINNNDRALKPAMLASLSVITGQAADSIAIPQDAVVYEGDQAHVFVARNGAVEARTVKVGQQNGDLIEVTSGLRPGENIISSGALFIDRALKDTAS